MKRKILNSSLFTAIFSLSLSSCNKKKEAKTYDQNYSQSFVDGKVNSSTIKFNSLIYL